MYIAMHATPTARDFFPASFFLAQSPAFIQNIYRGFCVLAVANTGSCVGSQNKIFNPAHRYRQLMQVPVLSARGILIGPKTRVLVFMGLRSPIVDMI